MTFLVLVNSLSAFEEAAQLEIDKHLDSGVLVECDEPNEWFAPRLFIPEGNGKQIHLLTDYTQLNEYVVRPVHPFPSVSENVQSIPASSLFFAKLDATHEYFQLSLTEQASDLTTFLLPSGRYHYIRAPMGLMASFDEW